MFSRPDLRKKKVLSGRCSAVLCKDTLMFLVRKFASERSEKKIKYPMQTSFKNTICLSYKECFLDQCCLWPNP